MRTRAFVLTGVALLAFSAAHARINHLEPWSPGYDAGVPDRALSHALNVFIGNDAQGVDATEFAYTLTTPVRGNWELGGGVSYLSYDAQGASESGLADLKLGAKRSLDKGFLPASWKGSLEAGLTLPTGDDDKGLGAGGFGVFGGGGLSFPIEAVRGYLQAGYTVYTKGSDTRWGNTLRFVAGAEYVLSDEWLLTGDLRLFDHARDEINGFKSADAAKEAYLAPGAVWRPADSPIRQQGTLLLGLTDDAFDLGFQLGLRF